LDACSPAFSAPFTIGQGSGGRLALGEALMIATRDSTGALPVEAAHAPAALGLEGESLKPT